MAAPLLQIEELTKSYGTRMLFADITFGINEGDKIGLIAKNGTGKTTMLRIIAGKESPDSGKIVPRADLRVAFLEQTPHLDPDATVLEACISADDADLPAVIGRYEAALASGDTEQIKEAMTAMDAAGAWDYEDRLKQLLGQLDINDLGIKVGALSGGQKKRVALARAILDRPDLLILDEPTNHLDIEVIEWLEGYLSHARVTLLMVTHDRYFLDRVCNKIIEIDMERTFTYEGDYDYYLRRRAERIEAVTAELARVHNTLRRETDWMRRQPQARAGKAKFRIDSYYDLKERSRLRIDDSNVSLNVNSSYIGSKIFEARGVSKRFGDKVILDDFTYTFARYEKLGIIGRNGAGKSTFIKMLQGIVPQDAGEWNVGETVRFGYYSQDGISFRPGQKVIDAVTDIAEDVVVNGNERYTPMQFLTRFLFSPADQQKYVETLSGGEKCRLHLATVLMRSPNFLVLDEPTNDLDIITLGILEDYLRDFKGCVIVISHDRFFLDSIVDHLFVMEGNGVVKDFPGNYTDFRRYQAEMKTAAAAAATAASTAEVPARQRDRKVKMTFKQRKEFEQLTADIDSLNAEKAELEALFNSGSAIDDIADRAARYESVKAELDDKELRWLELSELE